MSTLRCPQWAQKYSTFSDPQLEQVEGGGENECGPNPE